MDSFKELSPEEIKMATLQFMGQHLTGDLKVLDQHIVSKNRTLQGATIDPVRVLNTIPSPHGPYANVVNAGVNIQHQPQPINIQPQVNNTPPPAPSVTDPNQLEFTFKQTDVDDIFNKIDRIESKIDKLLSLFDNKD